jgi:hypothetical protein
MNALQHIPYTYGPVLVTLNPPSNLALPDPQLVQSKQKYAHPVVSPSSVASQREMWRIQGKRGISYAGAWLGYGFHEDGWVSGMLSVLTLFGVQTQKTRPRPNGVHTPTSQGVALPQPVILTSSSVFLPSLLQSQLDSMLGACIVVARPKSSWDDSFVRTLAWLFDSFESCGLRTCLGVFLGSILRLVGFFLGVYH